jgi:hypothetical protein
MRGSMLTEDIDSSMRTVERGLRIRSDRHIVSRELGTTTFKQVWNQRLRWAQGWFQVTMMHTMRVWRSSGLTFRQKFGATYLLGWREVYPWLSLQIFPLVAFWMITRGDRLSHGWPILFCTTVFVLHVGPMQTLYAYRMADEEIKQHKRWFWAYLFFSTLFYTEYKNTVARVAHIKEFVGERAWKVTPRSNDPVEFDDDFDLSFDADHELGPAARATPVAALVASDGGDEASSVHPEPLPVRRVKPMSGRAEQDDMRPSASEPERAATESDRMNVGRLGLLAIPRSDRHPLLPGPSAPVASSRIDELAIAGRIRRLVEEGKLGRLRASVGDNQQIARSDRSAPRAESDCPRRADGAVEQGVFGDPLIGSDRVTADG